MDVRLVGVVTAFGVLAVLAGSAVTTLLFRLVDRREGSSPDSGDARVQDEAAVLRGGVWIGALERLAIYGGLLARWPDAIVVVLAVKGLGRYPELRNDSTMAVAERFIIGTFVSVLWACGCAGLAMWLR